MCGERAARRLRGMVARASPGFTRMGLNRRIAKLHGCMEMKKHFSTVALLIFCLSAGGANAFGQNPNDYWEVETYDDLYAATDVDGVREYTNAPRTESVAYAADAADDYSDGYYEDELLPAPGQAAATAAAAPAAPKKPAVSLADIEGLIEKYAEENNLDPVLIRSIVEQESGFNHLAVSRAGARGLMQLMPATAQSLGVRNSFDPEENIRAGVRYFRSLMDKFDENLELSLAAYNAGENIVSRLGRIPDYKETKAYVASIKRKYEMSAGSWAAEPPEPRPQPIMRYTDDSGVTHLTNIRTIN